MRKFWLISLLLTASCIAWAQQDSVSYSVQLDQVELVTKKKQETAHRSDAGQTVKGDQIQSLSPDDASEVLRQFSGVHIRDYGGVAGFKSVNVRGLNASHVLHLNDGVPISSLESGMTDLSLIPAFFLKQIDLSKAGVNENAQVTGYDGLYASVLRMDEAIYYWNDSSFTLNGRIGTGSFGTYRGDAMTIVRGEKTQLGLALGGLHSEGDYGYRYENGTVSESRTRQNSDVEKAYARLAVLHRIGKSTFKTKLSLNASDRGLPGAVIDYNPSASLGDRLDTKSYAGQLEWLYAPNSAVHMSILVGYQKSSTHYHDEHALGQNASVDDQYGQKSWYASAKLFWNPLGSVKLNLSNDVSIASYSSDNYFLETADRKQNASTVSLSQTIGKFHWQASTGLLLSVDTRKEEEEVYVKMTPGLALQFRPSWQYDLRFNAGAKSSTRMPTFNEQFIGSIYSRGLKPEDAIQVYGGLSYQTKQSKKWSLAFRGDAFYNWINNKIVGIPSGNLFFWSYRNIGEALIYGIDANTQLSTIVAKMKLTFGLNVTLQHSQNLHDIYSATYGNDIPYLPRTILGSNIGVSKGRLSLLYKNLYSGDQYRSLQQDKNAIVDAWLVHDLILSYKINKKKASYELQLVAKNLLDKQYEVIAFYPMPSRSFDLNAIIRI